MSYEDLVQCTRAFREAERKCKTLASDNNVVVNTIQQQHDTPNIVCPPSQPSSSPPPQHNHGNRTCNFVQHIPSHNAYAKYCCCNRNPSDSVSRHYCQSNNIATNADTYQRRRVTRRQSENDKDKRYFCGMYNRYIRRGNNNTTHSSHTAAKAVPYCCCCNCTNWQHTTTNCNAPSCSSNPPFHSATKTAPRDIVHDNNNNNNNNNTNNINDSNTNLATATSSNNDDNHDDRRNKARGRRKRSNSVCARNSNFYVHADINGLKSLFSGKVMTLGFGFRRSRSVSIANDEIEFDADTIDQVLTTLRSTNQPLDHTLPKAITDSADDTEKKFDNGDSGDDDYDDDNNATDIEKHNTTDNENTANNSTHTKNTQNTNKRDDEMDDILVIEDVSTSCPEATHDHGNNTNPLSNNHHH